MVQNSDFSLLYGPLNDNIDLLPTNTNRKLIPNITRKNKFILPEVNIEWLFLNKIYYLKKNTFFDKFII